MYCFRCADLDLKATAMSHRYELHPTRLQVAVSGFGMYEVT